MSGPVLPRSAAPASLRRITGTTCAPQALPPREPVRRPDSHKSAIATLAGFASLGAAAIHIAVVPEHADWVLSAAFFAALAAFQLTWGALVLLRPVRALYLWSGLGVNAVAILMWLQSRIGGLPFGPQQGEPESFARTDVLAAVLQLAVVVGVGWMLAPRRSRLPARRPRLVAGSTAAGVAAVAVFALSGAGGHGHAPGQEHMDGGHGSHGNAVMTTITDAEPAPPTQRRAGKAAGAKKTAGGKAAAVPKDAVRKPAPAAHDSGDGHAH